jgi:glyoxylase-like metal-dependent hydrolase (beta-lactamase superfamily II)
MESDNLSDNCCFSIRKLNRSTYLIRERDKYGEYPHIYAKLCQSTSKSKESSSVIVLSDTGCATKKSNSGEGPAVWDIGTFLEYTINPGNKLPYLVVTTHCHYDHILGIVKLPPTALSNCWHKSSLTLPTTVLSSSHDKSFLTPYKSLNDHSLAPSLGLSAPHYKIGIWADDLEAVNFTHPLTGDLIETGLTILHTPGHTPDSLTWYDNLERLINVGDSIYDRNSHDAENAPWGKEPPMQIMFDLASDLLDWWNSVKKVIAFVKERNEDTEEAGAFEMTGKGKMSYKQNGFGVPVENGFFEVESPLSAKNTPLEEHSAWIFVETLPKKKRVRLCAAHVTADTDALDCLLEVQRFMARVLRDEVPNKPVDDPFGYSPVLWDDTLACDGDVCVNPRFSVSAPLRVVERGRKVIPKKEWVK